MNMTIDFFNTPVAGEKHFRIGNLQQLTGKEAATVREEIAQLVEGCATSVYLDATKVKAADLSGINEIIHTNYILAQAKKQFVFAYRQNSEVEKWVATTGLDKFVSTAILPA